MRLGPLILALATFSTGCTTISLQRNTLQQVESLSDLRYQQVLYNLAALHESPAVLPAYAAITAGTTTISDQGTVNPTGAFGREIINKVGSTATHFTAGTLDLMEQRKISQNWSLDPVSVPEKLQAMRDACWWVLFGRESVIEKDNVHLAAKPPKPTDPKSPIDLNKVGYYFGVADDLVQLGSCTPVGCKWAA